MSYLNNITAFIVHIYLLGGYMKKTIENNYGLKVDSNECNEI